MDEKSIRTYTRISQFSGLAMLILGALAAFDWLGSVRILHDISATQIAAGLATIAGVITRWAAAQLPSAKTPKSGGTGAVAAILAIALFCGCSPKYTEAWRALDSMQNARDLTAQQIAAVAKTKHEDCTRQHGVQTPEYNACIADMQKMLSAWQKVARPAINTSVQGTATALQIATAAKKKDLNWMGILRPAGCAIVRILRAWGHLLPDGAKDILSIGILVEMVTCE